MRRVIVLLGWSLLAGLNCVAAEKGVVHEWAEKLSEKFFEGGDRVFVYEVSKRKHGAMHVQVADCRTKRFAAMRLMQGEKLEQALGWFALGDGGEVGQWAVGPTGSRRMEGMGEVMDRLGEMEEAMGRDGKLSIGMLEWSLYLTDQDLKMAVDVAMTGGRRRAPWLKGEVLGRATGVMAGEEEVQFEFPDGQALVVRNDGVLLEQKAARGRSLRLVAEEPMKAWSVVRYFGKFDLREMKVEKVDEGSYYFPGLQTQVRTLLDRAVEKKVTEEDRGKHLETMTQLLRPLAGTLIGRGEEMGRMTKAMGILFQKSWAEFTKAKGAKAGSYSDFVKLNRDDVLKKLAGEREAVGKKFGHLMPPLFAGEERKGFEREQEVIAEWIEEVGREAFPLALLEEMVDQAVKSELEKEAVREAMKK